MFRSSTGDQRDTTDEGNQARPEKRRQVIVALVEHQREQRNRHADRQGNQENAEDETDETQNRNGHE
ncbi:hypothetical protein D3C78_1983680 [compost metagenome]